MARHLIIGEESNDNAQVTYDHFAEEGYIVQAVDSAAGLLEAVRASIPSAIVMSTSLPDVDAQALIKELRTIPRVSHVPIICLAPRELYAQSLSLLEVGADDCLAKPVDLEELSLRIENAVGRSERENMTDPRSGLPGAQLVSDHVQSLADVDGWTYLDFEIEHLEGFRDANGFVAADQVIHTMAVLLRDIMLSRDDRDFIGHLGDEHFVAVTFTPDVDELATKLIERFNDDVLAHHSFMDREMGFITIYQGDEQMQAPLMALSIGVVPRETLLS